jgi:hypothetical protein
MTARLLPGWQLRSVWAGIDRENLPSNDLIASRLQRLLAPARSLRDSVYATR